MTRFLGSCISKSLLNLGRGELVLLLEDEIFSPASFNLLCTVRSLIAFALVFEFCGVDLERLRAITGADLPDFACFVVFFISASESLCFLPGLGRSWIVPLS